VDINEPLELSPMPMHDKFKPDLFLIVA